VAEAATSEFFSRHPEWADRYGDRGRERGIEDAGFHLDFLAGSLEVGAPEAFGEYVRWARRVLEARGIAAVFLKENLEQIERELLTRLPPAVREQGEAALQAAFQAGFRACDGPAEEDGPAAPGEWERATSLFLQTTLRGERAAALGIARSLLGDGLSLPELYLEVLEPSQYEIGRLWESNVITVAEEHMATAVTQFVMAQCYPLVERNGACLGRMVLTGVEGEMHQIGANMIADVLEAKGWDVRFLGTNMPQEAIVRAVEDHRPDWIGISAALLSNLPRVGRLIDEVRERLDAAAPRIIVGGGAFRHAPGAWKEIGADAAANDLRQAIAILCSEAPPSRPDLQ
jgi:MerR family transcriptional regulator, light-induced transcriptional regulator